MIATLALLLALSSCDAEGEVACPRTFYTPEGRVGEPAGVRRAFSVKE